MHEPTPMEEGWGCLVILLSCGVDTQAPRVAPIEPREAEGHLITAEWGWEFRLPTRPMLTLQGLGIPVTARRWSKSPLGPLLYHLGRNRCFIVTGSG